MTDVNEGMKRCPFCGGEFCFPEVENPDLNFQHEAVCMQCGCRLPGFASEEAARAGVNSRSAQAGEAQETWRDISSAPKDGTRLWGADARSPHPIYYSIQYQQSGSHGAGWYTTWDATYVSGAVTHYMPLPQPPKGL